jgi:hypothetical protein
MGSSSSTDNLVSSSSMDSQPNNSSMDNTVSNPTMDNILKTISLSSSSRALPNLSSPLHLSSQPSSSIRMAILIPRALQALHSINNKDTIAIS